MRHSLAENDLTVVSIFVNPAQFAPHEDLATYPRTLAHDLEVLTSLRHPVIVDVGSKTDDRVERTPSVVFAPTVSEMYPAGITQKVNDQKGTFVEVKGYSHQMEGQARPDFFRGVATVVTKLFNIIQVCPSGCVGWSRSDILFSSFMFIFTTKCHVTSLPRRIVRDSRHVRTSGRRTYNKRSSSVVWCAISCSLTRHQRTCASFLSHGTFKSLVFPPMVVLYAQFALCID